ncbi:type II secretion system protein GspC [Gilvimarinus xylanilyticus]|uniref:Type II secretion system protein GspC n=1 Tax=Gilvimarinus xylanilyticus TaxID=2944139 RepID=A0A9X2I0A7_9GAMM|nr:type II secretion system protein GspC [Gilvimarinus xylanilyticus]MCP8900339.1 type II secretion system protein GspC [Gilvimarinus xylanilyticus]
MQNLTTQEPGNSGADRLSAFGRRFSQGLSRVPTRRWRQLALLIIVVWLAHTLAQLFWALTPAPEIPAARISANALSTGGTQTNTREVDVDSLKDLTVFGASSGEVEPLPEPEAEPLEPQIEDQAVDTKLSLVLQGVINSSDTKAARAIIADSKSQAIYGPGDELENMNNVKVAKVLNLRVILDNKGQYESLWLYKDDPNAPRIAKQYSTPVDTPSRSWEGDPQELSEGSDADAQDDQQDADQGPRERDEPRAEVAPEQAVEQARRNLSDVVAFNIHRENGKIKGYQVRPGRNAAAFEAVGLQSGDVVTAVNGTALDNPGRIMEIYRNMSQATSASLEVERDGEVVIIDVEL